MDSFQDILDRVLKPVAEKVTQGFKGSQPTGRRPLRDPHTDSVSFFQDIASAVRNIRSPEVTRALQARANLPVEQDDSFSRFNRDLGGNAEESPSSSAGPRKTTLRDDSRVAGELANAASSMVKQVVTAGGAIADFSKNTGKLDDAVSGMTGSAENASKAMKPTATEGF